MPSLEEAKHRAQPLLQPISAEAPAGENASLDPRYQELRAIMAGLDSPTGDPVQWPDVLASGQALLQSASKDLLVACYTAYALLRTEGPFGLAVGLELLSGLVRDYWDSMHPPVVRLRGRGNALEWFVAKLEPSVRSVDAASMSPAADLLIHQWAAFEQTVRDRLGEHCPNLGGVADALAAAAGGSGNGAVRSEPAPPSTGADPSPPPSVDATPSAEAAPEAAAPPPEAPPAPSESTAASDAAATLANEAPASEAAPEDPLAQARAGAQPWLEPIGEPPGVGNDPRYEMLYEEARREITKLDSLTDNIPDWEAVAKHCGEVLQRLGKDVLAASYLAAARFEVKGLSALPSSMMIVAGLFERFGDDAFPTRARGRGNAVGWFVDRIEKRLGELDLKPADRPLVLEIEKVNKHFASVVRERLEDSAPGMGPLGERIQRMLLSIPEAPKPKPEPPKPAAAQPAPAAAPPPTPAAPASVAAPMPTVAAADVSNAQDVSKFLLETGRALVTAAGVLRRADISSASAYRLLRNGLWLHLQSAPPADAGGQTKIPPLPAPRREQYETILQNANWAAAIEETESALTQFRFCLDLNRLTCRALDGLGHPHASESVKAEVRVLLSRMPNLPELTCADGTPLADNETKSWLSSEVLAQQQAGGGGETDDSAEAMNETSSLMKEGKAVEAMKAAQKAIDAATSLKGRYLRRLLLAELCLQANQPVLARGIFSSLERELRDRGLLEWERQLAGRCLEGFVRSIRAANKAGQSYPHADEIYERLCQVDPLAAAKLG